MSTRNHDYLTLIETKNVANKSVRLVRGEIAKKAGVPISRAIARTVHVPNVAALTALLHEIADKPNTVLAQGFFAGTKDGEPFQIMSKKEIEKATGEAYERGWVMVGGRRVTARLKVNMEPSTWLQLDRDYADGIPDQLAELDDAEWLEKIDGLIPDFSQAGWVRVTSTTGRVIHNGRPLDAKGCRYWFQIDQPDDAFGTRLLLQAAANNLGFHKVNKRGGKTLWSIFDPTVFSHERLVYDGQPTVGHGLSLAPPDIQSHDGPRIAAGLVAELSEAEETAVYQAFKVRADRHREGHLLCLVDSTQLTMQTPVDTEDPDISTVEEFWLSGKDHVRCQAPFRDSTSWNGFLALDGNRMPRVFDNGARTWYELPPKMKRDHWVNYIEQQLAGDNPAEALFQDDALIALACLRRLHNPEYQRLRLKIKMTKGVTLQGLEEAMQTFPVAGSPSELTQIDLARVAIRAVGTCNLIYKHRMFWFWDEANPGAWRALKDDTRLRKVVHEMLEKHVDKWGSSSVEDVMKLMGPECYQPLQMDQDTSVIGVKNGELSLVDGEWILGPHRKSTMPTVCLPVEFDPDAECPLWEDTLAGIFALNDDPARCVALVQQMFGYTLTRDCSHEKMIFLTGEGSNGKTVICYVLEHLIGAENVAAVQPKEYGNKFQRAHLEGKLANIVTETAKGDVLPDDSTKAMVTGELMTVEDKFAHPREIVPFAKLWHATNHLPVLKDHSYAIERRTLILTLPRNFDNEPEVKDKGRKYRITETELAGVLNWALEGLRQIRQAGDFIEVAECCEKVQEWVRSGDTVGLWFTENCILRPDAWTSTKDLMEDYTEWCRREGFPQPLGAREFKKRLVLEKGVVYQAREHARGYAGVEVRPVLAMRDLQDAAEADAGAL